MTSSADVGRRVSRSNLMMPVDVPQFVERAWKRGADTIMLDLEDAVAPQVKAHARTLVRDAIEKARAGGAFVTVRVNPGTLEEDLESSVWPGLGGIVYPKTASPDEVRHVDELLTALEMRRGLEPGSLELTAVVETVIGVWNAYEILTASPRIKSGGYAAAGDLTADLDLQNAEDMDVLDFYRGMCDLVARAAGVEVSGHPWVPGRPFAYSDLKALLEYAERCRKAGAHGGGGIHPNQITAFNKGLTPTNEEVQLAERLVAAFGQAWQRGEAFAVVDGRVVDSDVERSARDLLAFARGCEKQDAKKRRLVAAMQERLKP